MLKTISSSVGSGGVNRSADVRTVQGLLNANIAQITPIAALTEDGKSGPKTVAAIMEFQKRVVGNPFPDGRVDPGYDTLAELNRGAGNAGLGPVYVAPTPGASPGVYHLQVRHGNVRPPEGKNGTTDERYESTFLLNGMSFRGSIYPDDMSVKGRTRDGVYTIHIGFHKRNDGAFDPTTDDLIVKNNDDYGRPALIVNEDGMVPVVSDNDSKTISRDIHIHNGFYSARYSDGCPTIHPNDWERFIRVFLDAFPRLSDWQATNKYVGLWVGSLTVGP